MQSKSTNNSLDFFDGIFFEKNIENSEYMLYVQPRHIKSLDENALWLNVQRDIILNMVKGYYTVVHLDKLIDTMMSLEELDKDINKLYFVIQNKSGDYFIIIPPNDVRLLTEIVNNSLVWECGNLLNIAIFKEKPSFLDINTTFEKAEAVMYSFDDNLGFNISIADMEHNGVAFYKKTQSVLEQYHS